MGSWVKFNGQLHLDLSSPVTRNNKYRGPGSIFIKSDVEIVQNHITNKIKELFNKHFQNSAFNLDTGLNLIWMEDTSSREEFSWGDSCDGNCLVKYCDLKEIEVRDYSQCILSFNMWDRYGQVCNARVLFEDLLNYFKHYGIIFNGWSSTYVMTDDWCPFVYTWSTGEELRSTKKDATEEWIKKWTEDVDGYYGNRH